MDLWKFGTVLLFFSATAHAHVDTILPIAADGRLLGVPKEFGKVRLTLAALGSKNAMVRVVIGDSAITLPSCVSRSLKSKSLTQVQVTGSWYHNTEQHPPYLIVKFIRPGEDAGATFRASQDFMFNLSTGKLIFGRRYVATRTSGQYQSLKLPSGCRLEMAS